MIGRLKHKIALKRVTMPASFGFEVNSAPTVINLFETIGSVDLINRKDYQLHGLDTESSAFTAIIREASGRDITKDDVAVWNSEYYRVRTQPEVITLERKRYLKFIIVRSLEDDLIEVGGLMTEEDDPILSETESLMYPELTPIEDAVKLSDTELIDAPTVDYFVPLFIPGIGNYHINVMALVSGGVKESFTYHITATTTAPTLTDASLVGGSIIGMIFIDKAPYDNEDGIVLDSVTGTLDFTGTATGMIYAGQKITITIKK